MGEFRGSRPTRWKKLLAEYDAPPLNAGTNEALQDFIARRKRMMPDAWY